MLDGGPTHPKGHTRGSRLADIMDALKILEEEPPPLPPPGGAERSTEMFTVSTYIYHFTYLSLNAAAYLLSTSHTNTHTHTHTFSTLTLIAGACCVFLPPWGKPGPYVSEQPTELGPPG